LDPELLNMVPEPCAGVILLFPCTQRLYAVRRQEKERLLQNPPSTATQTAYHVKQVAEFGNACGTIASVHALINGATIYNQDPNTHSALQDFRDGNANASPQDRGRALLQTSALRSSSDQSASHRAAQTECPDRYGPDLDHHFVAFSPIPENSSSVVDITNEDNIHVIELDGTKVLPVDHGSIAEILLNDDTEVKDKKRHLFLRAVAKIIREKYMEVEPDSIEFSMMALCKIK
jgi:ubiquitin carboxyl-terminal hydrolase L3